MTSVNAKEIEQFQKDSAYWWDESGPFKPLHKLGPVRIGYIKQQICTQFDRDVKSLNALKDLSVVDVGCGGGLVCEPLTRLGAHVTGLDADAQAIGVAKDHAVQSGLEIDYRNESAESLLNMLPPSPDLANSSATLSPTGRGKRRDSAEGEGERFDVVLALEIIEHVNDPPAFVQTVCNLAKPGGLIIFSTLNRTPKSYALGIVAAEYILRWVPQGTHDWQKFVKPSELSAMIRQAGATPQDICGLTYSPLTDRFKLNPQDVSVNYFMSVQK